MSAFLASPERRDWVLRVREERRRHVMAEIHAQRCDVDYVTEERGRPYALVCTKNQETYRRLLGQRHEDLRAHAALAPPHPGVLDGSGTGPMGLR